MEAGKRISLLLIPSDYPVPSLLPKPSCTPPWAHTALLCSGADHPHIWSLQVLSRQPLGRERLWSGERKWGWCLYPLLFLGLPGWDWGQNSVSPPSVPSSLPSWLQLGWELGKLAMDAEEAIWRAQSPHLPVSPSTGTSPPTAHPTLRRLSGAPYTRCLWYPPDNIQVASVTAQVRGRHTSLLPGPGLSQPPPLPGTP